MNCEANWIVLPYFFVFIIPYLESVAYSRSSKSCLKGDHTEKKRKEKKFTALYSIRDRQFIMRIACREGPPLKHQPTNQSFTPCFLRVQWQLSLGRAAWGRENREVAAILSCFFPPLRWTELTTATADTGTTIFFTLFFFTHWRK